MNPTIVVILLCAIVAIHVRHVDSGGWHNITFKKIFKSATKSVKKTTVPKAIKTEPPTISLNTIFSYQDKFRLYAEIMQHKILERTESVTSIQDLDKFKDKLRKTAGPIVDIYKDIMSIGANLINEYDKLIDLKNEYFKSALYYRALHWIQFQTGYYKPIVDAAQKIIQSKKAKSYLSEIFEFGKEAKCIDSSDSTLNKLEGWSLTNKYDDAALFMKTIGPTFGDDALNTPMGCTEIEVYEEILQNADEDLFEAVFGIAPTNMIQIVDYAFDLKVKAGQINVESPRSEAPLLDQITLSATTNSMEPYKHASILYVCAMQEKLKLNFLTAGLRSDLSRLSTRYSPLRYNSLQLYMGNIPIAMTVVLDLIKPLRLFGQKSYLHQISKWYLHKMHNDQYPSKEFDEEMNKLTMTSHAKNIFADIPSMVPYKIEDTSDTLNTFESILKIGDSTVDSTVDSSLSFIMKGTFDQLQEERKENDGKIAELEESKDRSVKKQLNGLRKERTEIRDAIRNVLRFGMPTKKAEKAILTREQCLTAALRVDDVKFKSKFRINIADICDKQPSGQISIGLRGLP